MNKLKMYIGLNKGYGTKTINKNELIKRVISLFKDYSYNNINGFNISSCEWTELDYKENTLIFETLFNETDININIILNAVIPIIKEEFQQESILIDITKSNALFK